MSEIGFQKTRSQLVALKHRLVEVMADEQRLYQRHAEESRESDRWNRRAELALNRGSEELAGAALERSARHAAEASQYLQHYLEQKQVVEHLKTHLLDLESRVRQPSAIPSPVDTARLERNLAYLERWEDRGRWERLRLAARAELERDELGERLSALEREDRVERQLAELKTRLGKP